MTAFSTIRVPGIEAIKTLEARRLAYAQSGEYPFLIGGDRELERLLEAAEFNDLDTDSIIRESLNIDIARWLRNRRMEVDEDQFPEEEILGEWPGEVAEKGQISLHTDMLSRKIMKEVVLGLAITDQPWKLPAVLKFGDWNDCPAPEVHCAFFRKWQEQYGAQIVGVSGDVIECVVKNPPRDKAAALELAWQQYWYCTDIVDQGCGSVSNLAATLINSEYWFFWWD
jgi:hypothetical protein